jgi:hypothetical protein
MGHPQAYGVTHYLDDFLLDDYSFLVKKLQHKTISLLGKCSIHFLCGNWNFTFPSLKSITAPVVFKKGLPMIIGLEVLLLMSIIIKSIGTKVMWSSIITSFILP